VANGSGADGRFHASLGILAIVRGQRRILCCRAASPKAIDKAERARSRGFACDTLPHLRATDRRIRAGAGSAAASCACIQQGTGRPARSATKPRPQGRRGGAQRPTRRRRVRRAALLCLDWEAVLRSALSERAAI